MEREEWPDLRDPRNIRRALRQAQDNLERAAASPAPPPPSDVVEKIARAYEIGFRKGMAFGPPWPDMDDWLALTARDEAHQIAALQGSEGGHAGKLESAPTGGASDLLDGERASIEADARRFEYLLDHHSYHYGMSIAEPSPAEWGIQWQFQQTKPGEQYLSIRDLIDRDIEWRAAQDREDDEPTEAMQAAIKMHGELTASGDGASPYASTTASADTPHEQNTPSTPPDTPEGVSEAEAAMKEIFAKHGPALREALRPFQTLPAIGDEVVEAIRQMILVEEAEQTRLRSMPSAYSWNKVAVVDGKLDVLRKLSALHQAGKLPAETDMELVAAYGPNGEKLGDHVMSTADFRRAASIFTQGEQS